jgi:hypothetical protein
MVAGRLSQAPRCDPGEGNGTPLYRHLRRDNVRRKSSGAPVRSNPSLLKALLGAAALLALPGVAHADKIKNPTAVFSGLDKITGRIISFEASVDETVQFGALQMTPRVCFTRPPTDSPNTTTFVEVDEVTLEGKYRRIFTGWMFASSPGLHGIEHSVYDIWLVDCKGGTEIIAEPKAEDAPGVAQTPTRPDRGQRGIDSATLAGEPRLDVAPPRGRETRPTQQPRQRFFPTNPVGNTWDPAGNSNR